MGQNRYLDTVCNVFNCTQDQKDSSDMIYRWSYDKLHQEMDMNVMAIESLPLTWAIFPSLLKVHLKSKANLKYETL